MEMNSFSREGTGEGFSGENQEDRGAISEYLRDAGEFSMEEGWEGPRERSSMGYQGDKEEYSWNRTLWGSHVEW